ncbi:hypothetical protein [Pseudonocardia sp. N23]|nr:hypothetical protein [Pseudonocardia sp. N23]GAY13026.1 hypothetical protein TOK_1755 [Pseudonocardia sp. N23]
MEDIAAEYAVARRRILHLLLELSALLAQNTFRIHIRLRCG